MPSRFPWSSKAATSSSDQNLDIPRSSSRQEVIYTTRQSPLEPPYEHNDPNQQAFLSTTSFESSSPPGSSHAAAAPLPQLSQQRNYSDSPYEPAQQPPPLQISTFQQQQQQPLPLQPPLQQQQPSPLQLQPQPLVQAQPPPVAGTRLHKAQQPPKKSFRSKLLGSSKEDAEHSRDGIFGRKRSVRKSHQDVRTQHWSHVESPDNSQSPSQQHRYGFYAPDIDEESEIATHPQQEVEPQIQQAQQQQQLLLQQQRLQLEQQEQLHQQQLQQQQQQQQILQQQSDPEHEVREPHLIYTAPPDDTVQNPQQPHFEVYRNSAPQSPTDAEREKAPPSRSSYESFPQPPSRPDSRPISRQSYDRNPGQVSQSASQTQLDQYQAQPAEDPPTQPGQQQTAGGGASLMAPPPPSGPRLHRQDSGKPALSRENSGLPDPTSQAPPRAQQLAQDGGELRTRTPPPQRSASDMTEAEVNQLIRDHKELKQKYNNVKKQYFERKDQVDTLQNTLAQQRIIQSRTQWDDGEYMTRMNRLDGLVSQLAFGMRKDWKVIPEWLQPYCNKDALQIAKQEMTAVGRAFISRWLADELFDKFFHPGLEHDISTQLKTIQRNIREYAPMPHNAEEEEALAARITNWRLATVDGLQPMLGSQDATALRQALSQELSDHLVYDIKQHMQEPGPAGLEGGVLMIIELAVSILANLPQESRDVNIAYFPPGYPIHQDIMKIETGIPTLPGSQPPDTNETDPSAANNADVVDDPAAAHSNNGQEQPRRGFFGSLVGSAGASSGRRNPSPTPGRPPSQNKLASEVTAAGASSSQSSLPQAGLRDERVRMCVFLGAQTRGKMVLFKAPVYRL